MISKSHCIKIQEIVEFGNHFPFEVWVPHCALIEISCIHTECIRSGSSKLLECSLQSCNSTKTLAPSLVLWPEKNQCWRSNLVRKLSTKCFNRIKIAFRPFWFESIELRCFLFYHLAWIHKAWVKERADCLFSRRLGTISICSTLDSFNQGWQWPQDLLTLRVSSQIAKRNWISGNEVEYLDFFISATFLNLFERNKMTPTCKLHCTYWFPPFWRGCHWCGSNWGPNLHRWRPQWPEAWVQVCVTDTWSTCKDEFLYFCSYYIQLYKIIDII